MLDGAAAVGSGTLAVVPGCSQYAGVRLRRPSRETAWGIGVFRGRRGSRAASVGWRVSPCPPARSGLAFAHAAPRPWLKTLLHSVAGPVLGLATMPQALAEIPAAQAAQAEPREIRIGVLSHRGDAATERTWAPTAEYLSAALPGQRFRIEPLDFAAIDEAVAANRIDFVLVNPAIYVNLEVRHRVSRIATLRNRVGERESNVFGGVIFTRADRSDIRDPGGTARALPDGGGPDLPGRFRDGLGGTRPAWYRPLARPHLALCRHPRRRGPGGGARRSGRRHSADGHPGAYGRRRCRGN